MFANRTSVVGRSGYAVAILALIGVSAVAQDANEEAADEEVIEEIVVIAGDRPGDPIDLDALHEEMMRDMLKTDLDRLDELGAELEWRKATDKTINANSSSRIKWGYDPNDELQMRNDLDMSDVQGQTTRPATVFRIQF
jgi:hypothetical protein